MVEPVVYAGLGFLVACLAFLGVGRALWRRAVRSTTRRLVDRLPMSRTDIVAERDFVRAEAAVQLRAMERHAERLQAEVAESRVEIGRRDAALSRLKGEAAAGQTGSAAAEMLRVENHELRAERAAARTAQAEAEAALGTVSTKLARAEAELAEVNVALDVQRVEIAALRTDLANVEGDNIRRARDVAATQEAAQRSAAERERALRGQIGRLEAELAERTPASGEAAAERAELRGRIEQLAAEIARLSAAEMPQHAAWQRRPGPAVAMVDGNA
jgi:chromosome segregation ATPase